MDISDHGFWCGGSAATEQLCYYGYFRDHWASCSGGGMQGTGEFHAVSGRAARRLGTPSCPPCGFAVESLYNAQQLIKSADSIK
jgi:hypothetical protein